MALGDDKIGAAGLPPSVRGVVEDRARLDVLARITTLEVGSDQDFDRLTSLAAAFFEAPVALITFVDAEEQAFRYRFGVEETGTPVAISFCAHAIAAADDVMVVEDAAADPRFAANPLVTGPHHVRFYAGAPIAVAGQRIGTLCVLDRVPRPRPAPDRLKHLTDLAALASGLFALKDIKRAGVATRAALLREERRRAIAVKAADLASWVWDVNSDTVECDVTLPALYDLPPATRLTARRIFLAIDQRDVGQTEERFRASLASSDDYFGEFRVRDTHPPRWLATRGRVVERNADGAPLLVFGVSYDISERKAGEERQRLLLRELNHRVKNTLATVQALATQTVRHAARPAEFLAAFNGRLQALGAAHSLLSDREWRGIGIAELVRREVQPFDDIQRPRIAISGRDALLTPDQALGLGLVLHELASNALKYGSLSVPDGRVEIGWRFEGRGARRRIVLTWREHGGPPVAAPARQGFGSILIRRSLAKVLDSEVTHDFLPEGVAARISMPLEQVEE